MICVFLIMINLTDDQKKNKEEENKKQQHKIQKHLHIFCFFFHLLRQIIQIKYDQINDMYRYTRNGKVKNNIHRKG
jgi:hypothetical protein